VLAGLLLDRQAARPRPEALDTAQQAKAFAALIADRRGDVLLAQGKRRGPGCVPAAYKAMDAEWTTAAWSRRSSRLGARPQPAAPPLPGGQVMRRPSSLCLVGRGPGACGCWRGQAQADAVLESITAQIAGQVVWRQRRRRVPFALMPTARGEQFVVGRRSRCVAALSVQDGRRAVESQAGAKLTAGVGSDGRFAAVVTGTMSWWCWTGHAKSGASAWVRWSTTAPLVAGERVFVMGVDRAVQAYDAVDGRYLWELRRPGEPLTAVAARRLLAAFKDTLVVGQGPRLAGVDPTKGTVRWELPMWPTRAAPTRWSELADLVGPIRAHLATWSARAPSSRRSAVQRTARQPGLWSRLRA
jgi:hypothetical protein